MAISVDPDETAVLSGTTLLQGIFFVYRTERVKPYFICYNSLQRNTKQNIVWHLEGWAQDYGNSNIFLKPLFSGKFDPFVNNANLGAIAHTSNGT